MGGIVVHWMYKIVVVPVFPMTYLGLVVCPEQISEPSKRQLPLQNLQTYLRMQRYYDIFFCTLESGCGALY